MGQLHSRQVMGDCDCDICAGRVANYEEWEANAIKTHGYYMHYVTSQDGPLVVMNAHTHRVPEWAGHCDFQIVLNIRDTTVHYLFSRVVAKVKAGHVYKHGDIDLELVASTVSDLPMPIRFVDAEEDGRPVLRMILPDKQGKVMPDEIARGDFHNQYLAAGIKGFEGQS